MIIKARQYLNKQGMLSLYYSFTYPYLTYCNHIWGSTYKTSLKRLTMLQNKAVRIIAHARWRESCDPIYKKLNIMKLDHINTYLIGRFMFSMYVGKVPEYLTTLFKKNSEFHSYNTRIADLYHIPCVKLDLSKTGIKYKGATVWNLIAQEEINLEVCIQEKPNQNDKQWFILNIVVSCRLTHLPLDKLAAISQATFSNAFSEMKMLNFHSNFNEVWSNWP